MNGIQVTSRDITVNKLAMSFSSLEDIPGNIVVPPDSRICWK
jgi:hypothetical protein